MLGYKYISRLPLVTLKPMVLMPPYAFPVMESFSIIIQDVKNDSAVVEEHGTDDQCMMRQDRSQISGHWGPHPSSGGIGKTIYLSYFTRVVFGGFGPPFMHIFRGPFPYLCERGDLRDSN